MKKILVLFFSTSFLLACNSNVANKEETSAHTKDSLQHEEPKNEVLSLNNGMKWNSDESTNENVKDLTTIVNEFNLKKEKNIIGYNVFATDLQNSLNTLIKECRMKGPDHDALHLWLEPILKDVNSLKEVTKEDEATTLFNSIDNRVKMYDQYFE